MISPLTFYTKVHHPTECVTQENKNLKCKGYNIIIARYHETCTNPERKKYSGFEKKLEMFETCLKSHNRSFCVIEISKGIFFASRRQNWTRSPDVSKSRSLPLTRVSDYRFTWILACPVRLNNRNLKKFSSVFNERFMEYISVVNLKWGPFITSLIFSY